jgi:hypothetical protein
MGVGNGNLPTTQKYVVLLEFYGGAPLSKTRELKRSLDALVKRYKGKWKENVSADKRKGDPRNGWVKGFTLITPQQEAKKLAGKRKKGR